MSKDGWIRGAMTDDTVVVELLLRLKHQCHATPPTRSAPALPPLDWGIRQPRSKPVVRCGPVAAKKGKMEPARGSPTTPLSWSGGTASTSATADGGSMEEHSRPEIRYSAARSKAAAANDSSNTPHGKRPRKKKTFIELKEEESLLLKERKHLRKGIAALRVTVKEHRAANERLKRLKRDMDLQAAEQATASPVELGRSCPSERHQANASHLVRTAALPPAPSLKNAAPSGYCEARELVESQDSFLLPDLNMVPSEDDFGTGPLFATS